MRLVKWSFSFNILSFIFCFRSFCSFLYPLLSPFWIIYVFFVFPPLRIYQTYGKILLLKFPVFCASNLRCTNVLCLLPLRLLQDYLTADYACAAQHFNAVVNDCKKWISWMCKHHNNPGVHSSPAETSLSQATSPGLCPLKATGIFFLQK